MGQNGYITQDDDKLSIVLFYKTSRGVIMAGKRLKKMGACIEQEGDAEINATFPEDCIADALDLIKASRIPMRNPAGNPTNLGFRAR